MENPENEKSISHTWKNHGILKKGQNHGKIMEFQNIHLLDIDHGKMVRDSWKIMEKSLNLIPGKHWEP